VGDFERTPPRGAVSRAATLFWWLVLGGSLVSVVLGFAGGRSIGGAAIVRLHPRAARPIGPAMPRPLVRALFGTHSLDGAADVRDAYDTAEDAVAARPDGWAPAHFDAVHERARVALVVIDAGVVGTPARAFFDSPIPFTLVIPADDAGARRAALAAGKHVLIDDPRGERLATTSGTRAFVFDPLLADDDAAAFHAARRAHVAALTRDVILDARSDDPYLDVLFGAAYALAQRTGVATVALHARPQSYDAAERFAVRAERNGIDIVPLDALIPSMPSKMSS
jgi:hypothetical protein